MGSRNAVGVEVRGDLAEAVARGTLVVDARGDRQRNLRSASARGGLQARTCRPSPFDDEPLKFIDRDQLRTPRHFDCLDVRKKATKCGAADAERFGSLAAGVGEPLYMVRFAHDDPRSCRGCWQLLHRSPRLLSSRDVATRFVGESLLPAA
jgi:hypothetical protein